jgi:hypothetical protein
MKKASNIFEINEYYTGIQKEHKLNLFEQLKTLNIY